MAEGGDVIDLLTIEEVAERLRVSVLTVRWLRQRPIRACDQGWPPPGMGCSRRCGLAGISPRTHGGGLIGVQRYTLRSGAVRCRGRVKSSMAARWLLACLSAGPTRSPGSRTSAGGCGLGSGLTPAVAGFLCQMWRPNGSIPEDWSSAGPARATSRTGATTSGLVSATGRLPLSRPLKCRHGLADWLTVAWPQQPRPAPWPRCAPSSRSPWLMAGSSTTWRRLSGGRPAAAPGGKGRRSPWTRCTHSRRPAQARIATWCRSWRWPACAGASWLASRSATGYLCLVLACG
jgi:hypothetical protein